MKVVAVSHACVVDVNQQLFVAMNDLPDISIELIIPAEWKSEYSGAQMQPSFLPDIRFPIYIVPVEVPGHISLHFYRSAHRPSPLRPSQIIPVHPSTNEVPDHPSFRSIRDILERTGPDIVFIDEEPWSLSALQLGTLCKRMGIPFVCHSNQNIYKRYPLPFRMIERHIYNSTGAIIVLSEEVRDVLRKKGYGGYCPVLAMACDLALFKPLNNELKLDTHAEHDAFSATDNGSKQDTPTECDNVSETDIESKQDGRSLRRKVGVKGICIGYMGRFVPEKGVDTLIRAVGILKRSRPTVSLSLLLVGAGQEEAGLRTLAAQAGIEMETIFTGTVPHREAGNYMNCMDIFVLPSRTAPHWKEQFGRVIVEALACRVPVIGSNSGQIPYLVQDTGGGLVFEEGNEAHLAEQLARLVDDPQLRETLGEEGRKQVEARFTYHAIASQMVEILRNTLNGKAEGNA